MEALLEIHIVRIALQYWPALLSGTIVTLQLTCTSLLLSIVCGLLGCFGRLAKTRIIRILAGIYVEVVRGTPLILQLFIVYFSLTQFGIVLTGFVAATIALGVFGGAYLSEIFRSGVQAIDRGQIEAAYSLGMEHREAMQKIVLPQAVRIVLPPLANYGILTLKNTSIVVVIAVPDLMYEAYSGASFTFRSMEFFLLAGMIYLSFTFPLSRLLATFEDRWNVEYGK